jgi:hypothetical protein
VSLCCQSGLASQVCLPDDNDEETSEEDGPVSSTRPWRKAVYSEVKKSNGDERLHSEAAFERRLFRSNMEEHRCHVFGNG